MTGRQIIQAQDIQYRSGRSYVLNKINWTVREGEHWVIFGLNGSGKTTLLSMIAGFKSPTAGTLKVFGQPYTKDNIISMRKRIGWVSSSFFDNYYSRESALDIVLSGLTGTFHVDPSITDRDVKFAKDLLHELRLENKFYRPFSSMSKGERQNVLIARALITRPEVLVLDEPGTGLDVYARERMMRVVQALAESDKVTVLYVTHYPEEIQPFMSKALLLRNGKIFFQGDAKEALSEGMISAMVGEKIQIAKDTDGTMHMTLHDVPPTVYNLCYGEEAQS